MQIHNSKDIGTDGRLKVLVYGESGVGKTVFAASFPKPLFLAADEGLLSVAEQGVDYVPINKWAELDGIYDSLLGNAKMQKAYDTIVVDSITHLQQKAMGHVLEARGHDYPDQQDWGRVLELMRRFLRQMGDLPYNIVFTALEQFEKDSLTEIVKSKPAVSGRMSDETPAYVDIVMHLIVEESKKGGEVTRTRIGVFQPNRSSIAKDRSGKLPVMMVDPTGGKVIAKVRGTSKAAGTRKASTRTTRTSRRSGK